MGNGSGAFQERPQRAGENHLESGVTSDCVVELLRVGDSPARSCRPVLAFCAEDWNSLLNDGASEKF